MAPAVGAARRAAKDDVAPRSLHRRSTAVVAALDPFFGTDTVRFMLDSHVTGTTRDYEHLRNIVKDVDSARVLVGFHFRHSDEQGSALGRKVGRYVVNHCFQRSADAFTWVGRPLRAVACRPIGFDGRAELDAVEGFE